MNEAGIEFRWYLLAIVLIGVFIVGVVLMVSFQKQKPKLTLEYGSPEAYDLLQKFGLLGEPAGGVVPHSLGITASEFKAYWASMSSERFSDYRNVTFFDLNVPQSILDISASTDRDAVKRLFLIYLLCDSLQASKSGYSIQLQSRRPDAVDAVMAVSTDRSYNVSKYVLDASEPGTQDIDNERLEDLAAFLRTVPMPR